jgi:hypothetical protein
MSPDDDVLYGIKATPARMTLPPGVPPGGLHDRRNHARRDALVRRILAEFDDMPGMSLSLKQAGRFLGIDDKACARILDALMREGDLRRTTNMQYVRTERPRPLRHAHG